MEEEEADLVADGFSNVCQIGLGVAVVRLDDLPYLFADLKKQVFVLSQVNEASGNNIRTASDFAGIGIK